MNEKVKGIQSEANQSTAKHHNKKDLRCQSAGNTWQDWHACQKWVDACFPDTPEDGSEENLASIEAGYLIVEGEHYKEHGPGCSCRPPPDSAEEAHFWGNDDAVLCCGRGCLRERSYYTLHNLTLIIDPQSEVGSKSIYCQQNMEHEQAAVDGKSLDMSNWRFALSKLSSSTRAEVQVWANSLGCRGIHSEVLPLT